MRKSLFTLFFALIAICSSTIAKADYYYPTQNDWEYENGLRYKICDDGHAEVCKADWSIKEVNIPASITTSDGVSHPVTAILSASFMHRNSFSKLTIDSENLKNIESQAFYGCNGLQNIEIYSNTVIGNQAFAECQNLKTLVLGKDVEKIGDNAFENTQRLQTIIVCSQVPPVCGKDAFKGAGYQHGNKAARQTEWRGTDEYGVYHGTAAAKGKYGNVLHYVNVKLATSNYNSVYPLYKNYAPIAYTENGTTKYSYQGWQKDRTNQYYIEFKPNEETGKNDDWTIDTNLLNGFGGDPWQRLNANFYYSECTASDLDKFVTDGTITIRAKFEEKETPVLSVSAISKSAYTPGYTTDEGFVEGTNTFYNVVTPAQTQGHDKFILAAGAKLRLFAINAEGENVEVASATATASQSLAALETQIAYTDILTNNVSTSYLLVLNNGDEQISSETATSTAINTANVKIEKAEAIYRSGTPDANTCAEKELFHNEISFTAEESASYAIFRNGEEVATLTPNGDKYTRSDNGEEVAASNGIITFIDNVEADPIAIGENTNDFNLAIGWNYNIERIDAEGNTLGSSSENVTYNGTTTELALVAQEASTRIGYSYAQIVSTTSLRWSMATNASDAQAITYEVLRSIDGGDFESVGTTDSKTFTDSYVYDRAQQTSGNWVNKPSDSEYKAITYYVKAITNTSADSKDAQQKNSNVVITTISQGAVFTAIENVDAENAAAVAVANGTITVNGANGTIEVYNTNGALVAQAIGNGNTTEIDATALASGVYVVKAANLSTKILIK